jgi:hypothetical protein
VHVELKVGYAVAVHVTIPDDVGTAVAIDRGRVPGVMGSGHVTAVVERLIS